MAIASEVSDDSLRISAVVRETGVSKELVHHYLRQGLLPRSRIRALYDEHQIRLLRLIRLLREDHHLPLDVIRDLFEALDFDPARIEGLTLGDSLGKRVAQFASQGELVSSHTLSADELLRSTGITAARLSEYVEARMVNPRELDGDQRFSAHDENIIALCERGQTLGVTFDWFRTIASYVRIAFDLAHGAFFRIPDGIEKDPRRALADLFLRREVADSFVQNVLRGLTQIQMRELLEGARAWRPIRGPEHIIYKPSPIFVRLHGLDQAIEESRRALGEAADSPAPWLEVAELLVHRGNYREGAFFVREALEIWPEDADLRAALGRVMVLAGDTGLGLDELRASIRAGCAAPLCHAYAALAVRIRADVDDHPETLIRDGGPILEHVEAALAAARAPGARGVSETIMLCGWLLTSLPSAFACHDRGLRHLLRALSELPGDDDAVPGRRERQLINTSYLLYDVLSGAGATPPGGEALPSLEELRARVCQLDPRSAFAETVYLQPPKARADTEKSP